jgi:hypothetical protein
MKPLPDTRKRRGGVIEFVFEGSEIDRIDAEISRRPGLSDRMAAIEAETLTRGGWRLIDTISTSFTSNERIF